MWHIKLSSSFFKFRNLYSLSLINQTVSPIIKTLTPCFKGGAKILIIFLIILYSKSYIFHRIWLMWVIFRTFSVLSWSFEMKALSFLPLTPKGEVLASNPCRGGFYPQPLMGRLLPPLLKGKLLFQTLKVDKKALSFLPPTPKGEVLALTYEREYFYPRPLKQGRSVKYCHIRKVL